jgi:hypothetical protein
VLPQQLRHGERRERRHERLALPEHVPAVLDRRDDGRVCGRPADAVGFQLLDQRGFGVARGRLRFVPLGLEAEIREALLAGRHHA